MEQEWSSIIKILLILIILSILGINIFYYLKKTGNIAIGVSKEIVGGVSELAGDVITTTEKGATTTVDVASGVAKSAISVGGGVLTSGIRELENVLDINEMSKTTPTPDNSDSSIQTSNKGGYCYVGTEKGYRSCIRVRDSNMCMSGKIFPSKDICINPSLRV